VAGAERRIREEDVEGGGESLWDFESPVSTTFTTPIPGEILGGLCRTCVIARILDTLRTPTYPPPLTDGTKPSGRRG